MDMQTPADPTANSWVTEGPGASRGLHPSWLLPRRECSVSFGPNQLSQHGREQTERIAFGTGSRSDALDS